MVKLRLGFWPAARRAHHAVQRARTLAARRHE
jgi:hypothetical protein